MVLTVTWLKASCHIQRINIAIRAYQMMEPQRRGGVGGVSFGLGGRFGLGVWSIQKSCMRTGGPAHGRSARVGGASQTPLALLYASVGRAARPWRRPPA